MRHVAGIVTALAVLVSTGPSRADIEFRTASGTTTSEAYPLQVRKFNFTAAQVLTFSNASGPDILPAISGHVYLMVGAILVKRAGPAFTGTQQVQIKYRNTALTPALTIPITAVFDQTTEEASTAQHPATGSHATDADSASIGGKAMMMSTNGGAAFTGTGSDCALLVWYRTVPVTPTLLDQLPTTPLP